VSLPFSGGWYYKKGGFVIFILLKGLLLMNVAQGLGMNEHFMSLNKK